MYKKSLIKKNIVKKFKKGDQVKVVAGKDKGKVGKIEKILSKENMVVIAGINQYKRHLKARSQNQPSEIITITKPLPLPNIAVVCPKCHLQTRIGFKKEKGETVRFCKKCKAEL